MILGTKSVSATSTVHNTNPAVLAIGKALQSCSIIVAHHEGKGG